MKKTLKSNMQTNQCDKLMIVNYPRSGSNFLFYMVYVLTDQVLLKTHLQSKICWLDEPQSLEKFYNLGNMERLDGFDQFEFCKAINRNKIKARLVDIPMIFLLRNYKECIPRQTNEYVCSSAFIDAIANKKPLGKKPQKHRFDYLLNLSYFENSKQPKLLIYYEDLIEEPVASIYKVLKFMKNLGFDVDWQRVDNSIENITTYQRESIKRYNDVGAVSYSEGSDQLFHSKKIDEDERFRMDLKIRSQSPLLFRKYLKKRYAEKDYMMKIIKRQLSMIFN